MTIFVVIALKGDIQALERKVESVYPTSHYKMAEREWLISDNATAVDVSGKLGITGEQLPTAIATVFSIGSYYGRAPNDLWDWMKVNLERPNNG